MSPSRAWTESRGDQRTGRLLIRLVSRLTWWVFGLFAFLAVCTLAGVRLNLSGSLPVALYVVTHGPPARGAVVLVCLPEAWAELARGRGYVPNGTSCPGGAMPVGKPVFALPGDTVEVTATGLVLHGKHIANTRPLPFDRRGRPLPRLEPGPHVVGAGELWIVSRYSPFSFDSRYFGAVPLANVRARVRLLVPLQRSRSNRKGDAALREPGEVESPGYEAPQVPDVEHQVDVVLGVRGGPAVDSHQLFDRIVASALQVRAAEVLDSVTRGTQRDQAGQSLDPGCIVVQPDFVALDRVLRATATADLASRAGALVHRPTKAIPPGLRDVAAHVRVPARPRHEFDGQPSVAEALRERGVKSLELEEPRTRAAVLYLCRSLVIRVIHRALVQPFRSPAHPQALGGERELHHRNNALRFKGLHRTWHGWACCTIFSCMSPRVRTAEKVTARGQPSKSHTAGRPAVRAPKRADLLSSVLASGALARLVIHFAVRPDERPHARALQRHTGLTPRSLQIELARLERLGVIERRAEGHRVAYALNERSPRWRALRQLIPELADPLDVLRDVLSDVPGIDAAFVFGSFARGDAREDSDVDVFVLGDDVPEDFLSRRTLDAGVLLGREVNVVSMGCDGLRRRRQTGSGFLPRVLAGPKQWLVGDEAVFGADRPAEAVV